MIELPLAASTPTWVWATLVTAAFVIVSAATMWLARYPTKRTPPPVRDRDADQD